MKKILSVFVLSIAMYIPLTLNAAFLFYSSSVNTGSDTNNARVNQPVLNCSINNFIALPTSITVGQSSTLSWGTSNCSMTTIYPALSTVNTNSSQSVSPTSSTTYTLTAYSTTGATQTRTVIVSVNQVNLEIQQNAEKVLQEATQLKKEAIDVQNENQQKIKELEERISNLESKPAIVEKVITPTKVIIPRNKEETIKTTVTSNKIVKPIIKQEEPKKETIEKPSIIIESPTTTETPIAPIKKSLFYKVLNWFKGLI